jgi:hypothetical protein
MGGKGQRLERKTRGVRTESLQRLERVGGVREESGVWGERKNEGK